MNPSPREVSRKVETYFTGSRITDDSLLITARPKVFIIILNWNGLEDTIECLESLKKITYLNYEVIVVDNASLPPGTSA